MATVTAALVKELRERTGAGMMECKKALVEANADIELDLSKTATAKGASATLPFCMRRWVWW